MGAGGGGGRDRLAVDPAAWRARLDRFVRGGEAELQCRENYGRDGVEEIHRLAAEQGLFSKAYGRGRHTVLVVSREPLPNYRADLDARLEGRVQHVVMDAGAKAMVKHVLASLPQTDEPHAEQAGSFHDAHDAHDAGAHAHGGAPALAPPPAREDAPDSWEDDADADAPVAGGAGGGGGAYFYIYM